MRREIGDRLVIIFHGVFELLFGDQLFAGPHVGVVEWSVRWLVVWDFSPDVVSLDYGVRMNKV